MHAIPIDGHGGAWVRSWHGGVCVSTPHGGRYVHVKPTDTQGAKCEGGHVSVCQQCGMRVQPHRTKSERHGPKCVTWTVGVGKIAPAGPAPAAAAAPRCCWAIPPLRKSACTSCDCVVECVTVADGSTQTIVPASFSSVWLCRIASCGTSMYDERSWSR